MSEKFDDLSEKQEKDENGDLHLTPEEIKKANKNPYRRALIISSILLGASTITSLIANQSIDPSMLNFQVLSTMSAWGFGALSLKLFINHAIYKKAHEKYPDKVYDLKSFVAFTGEEEEEKSEGMKK